MLKVISIYHTNVRILRLHVNLQSNTIWTIHNINGSAIFKSVTVFFKPIQSCFVLIYDFMSVSFNYINL